MTKLKCVLTKKQLECICILWSNEEELAAITKFIEEKLDKK